MYDIHVMLPDNPGTPGAVREFDGAGRGQPGRGRHVHPGGCRPCPLSGGDGAAAARAAEQGGLEVVAVREVLVRRLKQEVPGQLGPSAAPGDASSTSSPCTATMPTS